MCRRQRGFVVVSARELAGGHSGCARRRMPPLSSMTSWSISTARPCVRRTARQRVLRPQTFATLRYLIENPDRLVSKDELMEAVWHGIAVTDDSLVQCVHEIRRAIGDDAHTDPRERPAARLPAGADGKRRADDRRGPAGAPPAARGGRRAAPRGRRGGRLGRDPARAGRRLDRRPARRRGHARARRRRRRGLAGARRGVRQVRSSSRTRATPPATISSPTWRASASSRPWDAARPSSCRTSRRAGSRSTTSSAEPSTATATACATPRS